MFLRSVVCVLVVGTAGRPLLAVDDTLPSRVLAAMKRATHYFHEKVAVRGGYVYTYSLDLEHRRGEGDATPTEVWVQPPGTPTVGMAFLSAYEATKDPQFLGAAKDAARALIHGQLDSGGWADRVDFDPRGKHADRYRNGKGRAKGRNYSTLDDDKTQSAVCFMMRLDRALKFGDPDVREAARVALDALLAAQFPNGGFPQGWTGPVSPKPITRAKYPDYDWRTENRIKEYWDLYTLNDGLAGTVARTLDLAHEIYGDEKYRRALVRLGDFLLLAQMPEPQPGWAQQYDFEMRPAWARRFEPPAVTGGESHDAIETLMVVFELTGDRKYLDAIPPALAWLRRSRLADGRVARFYELRTNKPLYFTRGDYTLTHDDADLPQHYGFKIDPRIEQLERRHQELVTSGKREQDTTSLVTLTREAEAIVAQLDEGGRWLANETLKPLRPDADRASAVVSSGLFARNLTRLSEYLAAVAPR